MGGKHSACNSVARRMWHWSIARNIWLTATFIPGVSNTEADYQSRLRRDASEWKLHHRVFNVDIEEFGPVDVDLFASRLNYQFEKFVSWTPDQLSFDVDAFSIS